MNEENPIPARDLSNEVSNNPPVPARIISERTREPPAVIMYGGDQTIEITQEEMMEGPHLTSHDLSSYEAWMNYYNRLKDTRRGKKYSEMFDAVWNNRSNDS